MRGDLAVENGGLSVGTDTFTTALYTTRSQSTNDVVPWLPIVLNATIAGSSSIQGYWMQIGRQVTLSMNIQTNSIQWVTETQDLEIRISTGDLPLPADNGISAYEYTGTCTTSNLVLQSQSYNIVPVIEAGATVIKFKMSESTAPSTYYQVSDANGTFDINLTLSYLAA